MSILDLSVATADDVNHLLGTYGFKSRVDVDNDIILSDDGDISLIRFHDEKLKFFGVIKMSDKHEDKYGREYLRKYVDRMNYVSGNIKFSIIDRDDGGRDVFYSTSIPKIGSVGDDFLVALIKSYTAEVDRFNSLIDVLKSSLDPEKED